MHELSLMEEVRRLALEEMERQGGGRLRALTLRIGTLAGVDPEALRFAWTVVMEEAPTTGARLTIETVEATAFCDPCSRPFPCPDGLAECPACGAFSRELRSGRELELASLELELPVLPVPPQESAANVPPGAASPSLSSRVRSRKRR